MLPVGLVMGGAKLSVRAGLATEMAVTLGGSAKLVLALSGHSASPAVVITDCSIRCS